MLGAVAALALAGCSGKFACGTKGKCANDSAPSQGEIDACNSQENGTCGAELSEVAQCSYDHEKCTSDGNADLSTVATDCQTQLKALSDCCAKNPSDSACPSGS